jgi:hypothetical protein
MLIGIRGTMRTRCFTVLAVLFSFGFSALAASSAQSGQHSSEEDQPATFAPGAPWRGQRTLTHVEPCKTLRVDVLRHGLLLTDDFHGRTACAVRQ